MNRPNLSAISAAPVEDRSAQYFNMGQAQRQQKIAEEDRLRKIGQEELAAAGQDARIQAAKKVFANGINEQTIQQYGAETGDTETAAKMLDHYKTQQEITGTMLSHAKLQNDLVTNTNEILARNLAGWETKTPEEKLRTWNLLKGTAANLATFDDKMNLKQGIQLPDQPDDALAGAMYQKAMSVQQQIDQQNKVIEQQRQKAADEETVRKNKAAEKQDELTLTETRRHNKAVEEIDRKKAEERDKSLLEGIDPDTGKPYSATQISNAKNAISMERSIKNIDKVVSSGFDEAATVNQVLNTFKKKKTLSRVDILNTAKNPQQRKYLQAQLDFIVPHLRDQSGAAINADEYTTEILQYFPTVGDDKETIAQKRAARREEVITRKTAAGGMYGRMRSAIDSETGGGSDFDSLWSSGGGK